MVKTEPNPSMPCQFADVKLGIENTKFVHKNLLTFTYGQGRKTRKHDVKGTKLEKGPANVLSFNKTYQLATEMTQNEMLW